MKNYSLCIFARNRFALSNDTDADPMTDYSPGMWGISSQKSAIKYAREHIAAGDVVRVSVVGSDNYNDLANMFIKTLGLSQPLFADAPKVPASTVTNGSPATLSAFKKAMTVGRSIRVIKYDASGAVVAFRDTVVLGGNSSGFTVDKNGNHSWIYWGAASDWSFDNDGATNYYLSKGVPVKSLRVEYAPVDYGSVMLSGLHNAGNN